MNETEKEKENKMKNLFFQKKNTFSSVVQGKKIIIEKKVFLVLNG